MKIGILKTAYVEEEVDVSELKVEWGGDIGLDSVGLMVFYKGKDIGVGKKNCVTNHVQVTLYAHNEKLETYLVESIADLEVSL